MSTLTVDISAALLNKLNGVSKLNGVYEYEIDKPTSGQYPFATITPASFEAQFGDTQRNIRNYQFAVKVYIERTSTGFGNQKTERIMRETLDEIFTAFDNDTTLSGMVQMVKPVRGNLDYIDREIGDVRMCEIIVDAMAVVPST